MGRRILNLAALAIVCAGAAHLSSEPAAASVAISGEEYCCTAGNGTTCCGNWFCYATEETCNASNKVQ